MKYWTRTDEGGRRWMTLDPEGSLDGPRLWFRIYTWDERPQEGGLHLLAPSEMRGDSSPPTGYVPPPSSSEAFPE